MDWSTGGDHWVGGLIRGRSGVTNFRWERLKCTRHCSGVFWRMTRCSLHAHRNGSEPSMCWAGWRRHGDVAGVLWCEGSRWGNAMYRSFVPSSEKHLAVLKEERLAVEEVAFLRDVRLWAVHQRLDRYRDYLLVGFLKIWMDLRRTTGEGVLEWELGWRGAMSSPKDFVRGSWDVSKRGWLECEKRNHLQR